MSLAAALPARADGAPAPLADYQRRVASADLIAQALAAVDSDGDASGVAPALGRLRELLPPAEQVDAGEGDVVTVDNAWLTASLEAYERAPSDEARREIASGVEARLADMDEHLAALAEGGAAAHGDARARLDEILRRSEFR